MSIENENNGILDTDDGIEIEVIDTTPEEDRGKTPLPPESEEERLERERELDEYSSANVKKRVNQLTHRYHDERRAREALEAQNAEAIRIAQAIIEENKRLKSTLSWGQREYLEQAQARVELAQKLAEDKYRAAYESGDTEGVLAAQRAMHEAAVQKDKVQNFNPVIRDEDLQQIAPQHYTPQPQPVYNAPSPPAQGPDEKTLDWAARNPWFGAEPDMTSLAYGIHTKLVQNGVDPKSDEYFAAIDREMRQRFPERLGSTTPATAPARTSSPVAPAARSTASRRLTVTAHQAAIAKKLGVPLAEYARHAALLEKS